MLARTRVGDFILWLIGIGPFLLIRDGIVLVLKGVLTPVLYVGRILGMVPPTIFVFAAVAYVFLLALEMDGETLVVIFALLTPLGVLAVLSNPLSEHQDPPPFSNYIFKNYYEEVEKHSIPLIGTPFFLEGQMVRVYASIMLNEVDADNNLVTEKAKTEGILRGRIEKKEFLACRFRGKKSPDPVLHYLSFTKDLWVCEDPTDQYVRPHPRIAYVRLRKGIVLPSHHRYLPTKRRIIVLPFGGLQRNFKLEEEWAFVGNKISNAAQ